MRQTATLFLLVSATFVLMLAGCGATQPPPQSYLTSIPEEDIVGFTVGLAGQVDTQTPGPLPSGDVLARLVDAYDRSPISGFVPKSGHLVAVRLWQRNGRVVEIVVGPGYPGSHALVSTIDTSRDTSVRNMVTSAALVEVIKGLARERLSAEAKQQLDPGGTWLGG